MSSVDRFAISSSACRSSAMPVHSACAVLLVSESTGRLDPSSARAYQPRSGSQKRSAKDSRSCWALVRQWRAVSGSSNASASSARACQAA